MAQFTFWLYLSSPFGCALVLKEGVTCTWYAHQVTEYGVYTGCGCSTISTIRVRFWYRQSLPPQYPCARCHHGSCSRLSPNVQYWNGNIMYKKNTLYYTRTYVTRRCLTGVTDERKNGSATLKGKIRFWIGSILFIFIIFILTTADASNQRRCNILHDYVKTSRNSECVYSGLRTGEIRKK